jgi:two-component system, cell cycle sensor histidine kinase and response regulator CckA
MRQPIAQADEGFAGKTILLVEDEAFVREATCSILMSAGFCVVPAADAVEALREYESCARGIDLLMTDLVLPGRTGQELGEDLQRRAPQVKVLVTSGYGDAECNEDPARSTYFLAKPYSRRRLVEKIEKILAGGEHCRVTPQAS